MNTTTVKDLLANFEDQEFVQINLPKTPVIETMNMGVKREVYKDIPLDTTLYMRSEIENIDHLNCIYKDGNKFYLECISNAMARLCHRVFGKEYIYDMYDLEEAEYCLYLSNYDMNKAKKIMQRRVE